MLTPSRATEKWKPALSFTKMAGRPVIDRYSRRMLLEYGSIVRPCEGMEENRVTLYSVTSLATTIIQLYQPAHRENTQRDSVSCAPRGGVRGGEV